MSKIDWDRPLEAYHEDGRIIETKMEESQSKEIWTTSHLGCPSVWNRDGTAWDPAEQGYGWTIRNVTEPKADAFDTAFREGSADIPQWAWDRMKAEYIEKDGMAASFARYVMTKEDAPIDPALLKAREIVKPWLIYYNASIDAGELDDMPAMRAVLEAIQFGRELERGEVK